MTFRPIYAPRTRAREYCDLAIHIYDSCPHGCTYCYARAMAKRFGKPWPDTVSPIPGVVEATQQQLATMQGHGKKIMLCFTCDPYPVGCDTKATREIIRAIKASGNHVQILTKGDATAQFDFDLLDENDSFGVTWSGANGEDELGAGSNRQRFENVFMAKHYGIHTWMSCEPVLDAEIVMTAIELFDCVDLWRIGKLNGRKSSIDWNKFGHEVENLCRRKGRNYYIKEDLRKAMDKNP